MMNKPKVKLTQEAQDMIDMFSELDEEQCNELAMMLNHGRTLSFASKFMWHMQEWIEYAPNND